MREKPFQYTVAGLAEALFCCPDPNALVYTVGCDCDGAAGGLVVDASGVYILRSAGERPHST